MRQTKNGEPRLAGGETDVKGRFGNPGAPARGGERPALCSFQPNQQTHPPIGGTGKPPQSVLGFIWVSGSFEVGPVGKFEKKKIGGLIGVVFSMGILG